MKLRIYFRPTLAVFLLFMAAAGLWTATTALAAGPWLLPFALFYSALFALSAWSLGRLFVLERWRTWSTPERLLILAPHEDDCVISAGGVALCNRRAGGVNRIVYLAPDEAADMRPIRAKEAHAAWAVAGLAPSDLEHIAVLPPLHQNAPETLRAAATRLRALIDEFAPTAIVVPMFEGGHIHHDMLAAIVGIITTDDDRYEVYEAPEYTPMVSLNYTPHRIITLCCRWLFGLVSYYGPPDGIDGRPIAKFHLSPADVETKRRMLACFVSQNAPSLVETRCYPDRLVRMGRHRTWRRPFDFSRSYLRMAIAARRIVPAGLVNALLPGPTGTIGRDGTLTDWQREWSADG
jgi:LmbE family N-acetylglucosaminyl deacetylase